MAESERQTNDQEGSQTGETKQPQRFHPRKRAIRQDGTVLGLRAFSRMTMVIAADSLIATFLQYGLVWWATSRILRPAAYQDSRHALVTLPTTAVILLVMCVVAIVFGIVTALLSRHLLSHWKDGKGCAVISGIMAGLSLLLSVPVLIAVGIPMLVPIP